MITTPTTFIVGAGGSKPYGFPLGSELTSEIRELRVQSDIFQALRTPRLDERGIPSIPPIATLEGLNGMLDDLRDHPAESIDAFLESRQEDDVIGRIGKALIAAVMGRTSLAVRKHQPKPDEDWVRYITNAMCQGAATWRDFTKNRVTFVTFNFDQVIEERLTKALRSHYRAADEQLREMLLSVPVHHVHGVLPPLVYADGVYNSNNFGDVSQEWIRWIDLAATKINVIHDTIDDAVTSAAKRSIYEATVVCFLGLRYHVLNLARLDIPKTIKGDSYQTVFGSAKGLLAGEQALVRERFRGHIILGSENADALLFLRSNYVIRD